VAGVVIVDFVFYDNYSRLDLSIRHISFSSFNHSRRVSQRMARTGSYNFECIFPITLGLKYMYLFVYTAVTVILNDLVFSLVG